MDSTVARVDPCVRQWCGWVTCEGERRYFTDVLESFPARPAHLFPLERRLAPVKRFDRCSQGLALMLGHGPLDYSSVKTGNTLIQRLNRMQAGSAVVAHSRRVRQRRHE
jgi:hypothetical protein